jgi:hypothetical protein
VPAMNGHTDPETGPTTSEGGGRSMLYEHHGTSDDAGSWVRVDG